jgi:hypothetical protein
MPGVAGFLMIAFVVVLALVLVLPTLKGTFMKAIDFVFNERTNRRFLPEDDGRPSHH